MLCAAALCASCCAGTPAAVTFSKDIAPVLYRNCAPCHHAGGSGPFPLVSYGDARRHARQMAGVTKRRYMPPWLPDPGYGDFVGERRLTAWQIGLIEEWAAEGAPEGGTAPPAPHFTPGWQLGPPDMVVEASKAFTVPADGPNVFWNFVLSPPVHETRYVRAIEIRPSHPKLVHHANLLVDRTRTARLEEKHPGEGFPGMDLTIESDTFDPDSHFLFWKPGSAPYEETDGMAWRLDPGNDLVLNVHLQPSGKPEEERPAVGLYFTDKPQTKYPMLIQLERDGALNIPAGDADFEIRDHFRLPLDVDVLAVYPHAHYLGKLLEGWATLPSGERRWLVRIPDWDLNWQAVFHYRQPVFLPKGTVISMHYRFDNSDANPRNPNRRPKRVVGGNQATDEMGHLWLQVLPRGEGDQRAVLQEALMRRRLEKYPDDFTAHFNLGALLLARHDVDGAIRYLREAVSLRPDQPAALNTLGAAFEMNGQLDEAIEEFRQALRAQPGYGNARYNLANSLADEGRLDEAEDEFRQVLQTNPDDAKARNHLALLLNMLGEKHAQAGEIARAVSEFEEALRLDPTVEAARKNLESARAGRKQ